MTTFFRSPRILAHTIAFDPPGQGGCRQMARMLAASAARTYLDGDFVIIRNTADPIFLVQRHGVDEIYVETESLKDQELADLGNAWKFKARQVIDPSGHDIVLFLDVDCLIMRNLDHLFVKDDWDILYQPEPGRSIKDPVFHGYLTDIEMASLSRSGANAGSWAVRSEIYHEVMETWEAIMDSEPVRERRWRDQGAWNRLLLDAPEKHGWRVKPFEAHEIQFPLHLDKDWLRYKDAAILHCLGANNLEKIEFIFGMYMQKFYHDPKGTLPSLLDM